ncbi:MAG: S8 family serine peptidase [Myxococcales bacterium]|nr:S8 family serine peptidase [Myxococcales bacterium]
MACSTSPNRDPAQSQTASAFEATETDGVQLVGNGAAVSRQAPSEAIFTSEQHDYAAAKAAWEAAAPKLPATAPNDFVLQELSKKADSELVAVAITLDESPIDWAAFHSANANDAARAIFIAGREKQLEPLQKPLIEWLAANGATSVEKRWLVNQVHAVVSVAVAKAVLKHPDVSELHLSTKWQNHAEWTGRNVRLGTLMSTMNLGGYTGAAGSRSGGPIRIGIYDPNIINPSHVGWNAAGGGTRLMMVRDCKVSGCPITTTSNPNGDAHGTIVTAAASGSIESGQDSVYPGTNTQAQQDRSGSLRDARIYFYWGGDNQAFVRAIERAVSDGVDVFNYSGGGEGSTICNRFANPDGVNGLLASALASGMLSSFSVGNDPPTMGCRVTWPAFRTETLGVSGLKSIDDSLDYRALPMLDGASRGGLPIRTWTGLLTSTWGVDLVTPGNIRLLYRQPFSSGYLAYYQYEIGGTSIAAPVAAGAAGSLRQYLGASTPAQAILVNMLMLADGWDADTGQINTDYMSTRSGAGRLRMHSSYDLTGPWGWGWRQVTVYNGQTVKWTVGDAGPESSWVRQWKWATFWHEPNLDSVADIDFKVVNTCPAGGGPPEVIAWDNSYNLRSHFVFTQSIISGRCLEMQAIGYNVPSGGRVVWSADYYHSGDPLLH